jgi:BioD-like N-terminal domain of phosphotransacetylase
MNKATVNSLSLALRNQNGFRVWKSAISSQQLQDDKKYGSSYCKQEKKPNSKQTNSFSSSSDATHGLKPNDLCRSRPIYVAATQQHVGKTTTCLSLISGLKKRFPHSIGYIKPVGQQHVPVYSDDLGKEIRVDKDVTLIREHFNLQHIDYKDMSPVLIPKGYTKDYIDGKISHDEQFHSIMNAYRNIADKNEVILCEGTGHCAVGSIVGASNAKVASLIGADMVLVANGGLVSQVGYCVLCTLKLFLWYGTWHSRSFHRTCIS